MSYVYVKEPLKHRLTYLTSEQRAENAQQEAAQLAVDVGLREIDRAAKRRRPIAPTRQRSFDEARLGLEAAGSAALDAADPADGDRCWSARIYYRNANDELIATDCHARTEHEAQAIAASSDGGEYWTIHLEPDRDRHRVRSAPSLRPRARLVVLPSEFERTTAEPTRIAERLESQRAARAAKLQVAAERQSARKVERAAAVEAAKIARAARLAEIAAMPRDQRAAARKADTAKRKEERVKHRQAKVTAQQERAQQRAAKQHMRALASNLKATERASARAAKLRAKLDLPAAQVAS